MKLKKLDGEHLMAWQATLSREDFSNNKRFRSIRVLRNALNKAVKLRLLPFIPCAVLDIPAVERREVMPLEADKCHTLFAECKFHRVDDVITLAAMTGLRKGKLFALEWPAVNPREGVLTVRRSLQERAGCLKIKGTKSRSSRRVVALEPFAIQALMDK